MDKHFSLYVLCISEYFVCMYVYAPEPVACLLQRDKKRVTVNLGREVQMVSNTRWVVGVEPLMFLRSSQCLTLALLL